MGKRDLEEIRANDLGNWDVSRSPHDSVRCVNVTLVSPRGLPFETERSALVSSLLPFHGRYCREYRRSIAARAWINVVYGTVVAINR